MRRWLRAASDRLRSAFDTGYRDAAVLQRPIVLTPIGEAIAAQCRGGPFGSGYCPEEERRDFATCTIQSLGRWRLVDLGSS
jgi:hypothetical protein